MRNRKVQLAEKNLSRKVTLSLLIWLRRDPLLPRCSLASISALIWSLKETWPWLILKFLVIHCKSLRAWNLIWSRRCQSWDMHPYWLIQRLSLRYKNKLTIPKLWLIMVEFCKLLTKLRHCIWPISLTRMRKCLIPKVMIYLICKGSRTMSSSITGSI